MTITITDRFRDDAVACLVQIVRDENASPAARAQAARDILAYSDGRPAQAQPIKAADLGRLSDAERQDCSTPSSRTTYHLVRWRRCCAKASPKPSSSCPLHQPQNGGLHGAIPNPPQPSLPLRSNPRRCGRSSPQPGFFRMRVAAQATPPIAPR